MGPHQHQHPHHTHTTPTPYPPARQSRQSAPYVCARAASRSQLSELLLRKSQLRCVPLHLSLTAMLADPISAARSPCALTRPQASDGTITTCTLRHATMLYVCDVMGRGILSRGPRTDRLVILC